MKIPILFSILIFSISAIAQNDENDTRRCNDAYSKVTTLITNFTQLRDSILPISPSKKSYLDELSRKLSNGTLAEKRASGPLYYGDPDHLTYRLHNELNIILNSAEDFRSRRQWVIDKQLLDKVINGTLTVASNGYGNNPYQNMIKLIELNRNLSIFLNSYSETTADLKAKGQIYKIQSNDSFDWNTNSYYYTYSTIAQCQLAYLDEKTVERELNSYKNQR